MSVPLNIPYLHVSIALWPTPVLSNDSVVLPTIDLHLRVRPLPMPPQPTFLPSNILRLYGDVERRLGRVVLPWQGGRATRLVVGWGEGD